MTYITILILFIPAVFIHLLLAKLCLKKVIKDMAELEKSKLQTETKKDFSSKITPIDFQDSKKE